MANANVALVRRWFEEVWNQKRADTIHELIAPDGVCYTDAGELRGPEEFRTRNHVPLLAALPDLRIDVEDTVAEGDQVVIRWFARGSHTGHGLGLAPTGQTVAFRGMTWVRIRDGRMVEGWDCWNFGGLMQTLRGPAGPAPGPTP
jgi:steroid delta-isomerase-like uncharacterized protein